nr:class I SAM-dependent methyltransferase [Candidatus Microthrix sp.]
MDRQQPAAPPDRRRHGQGLDQSPQDPPRPSSQSRQQVARATPSPAGHLNTAITPPRSAERQSEEEFANNYLAFHDTLPEVVRGLSSAIEDHVTAGSCRYIHIDASHMYVNVREDAAAARRLLRKDGVVVFDDFRTEHTIGTANAVWETIVNDDLHPICASERKMYATWGDPEPYQRELMERLAESGEFRADLHTIVREERVIRVVTNKAKKAAAAPAAAPAKTGATPVPAKAGASVPIKQFLNKVANKVQRLTA